MIGISSNSVAGSTPVRAATDADPDLKLAAPPGAAARHPETSADIEPGAGRGAVVESGVKTVSTPDTGAAGPLPPA